MNMKKMTLTALLSLGLLTIPALAQDTTTTSGSTSGQATTTDHNDTNSKTKHAMKKAGSKTKETAEEAKEKMSGSKKLDLNSADVKDIAALPGMDDASAQKVVDGRPYRMKSDLVKKGIVSKAEYDKIKGEVIAKHAKSEAASGTSSGEAATTTKAKHKTKKSTGSTTPPPPSK